MKCPYPDCQKEGMKPPKIGDIPHGYCHHCKRKSRASIAYPSGKSTVVKYSPFGYKKENSLSEMITLRLSKSEVAKFKKTGLTSREVFLKGLA